MASFPSMISNEPPPLDSDEDEDLDEDEFRSNGLRLDISGEPSPIASPRKPPLRFNSHSTNSPQRIPSNQSEITSSLVNGDSISPDQECEHKKTVLDVPAEEGYLNLINAQQQPYVSNGHSTIPQSISTITTGNCVRESESTLDESPWVDHDDASDNVVDVEAEEMTTTHEEESCAATQFEVTFEEHCQNNFATEIEEIKFSIENDDLKLNHPQKVFNADENSESQDSIEKEITLPQNQVEDDDSFGDFDVASFPNHGVISECKSEESIPDLFPPNSSGVPFCSFSQELSFRESIEDEDFGQFSSDVHLQPFPPPSFSSSQADEKEDELEIPSQSDQGDDFGDFAASELQEASVCATKEAAAPPVAALPASIFSSRLESLDAMVKSVFSSPCSELSLPTTTMLEPIDKELGKSTSNATWTHVQEFEDSHCLLHKWPRSCVHQLLHKSLNIDSSTILYSAKFGTIEVPKFASSLVDSPLQPQFMSMTQFDFLQRPTSAQSAEVDEDPLRPHSEDEKSASNSNLNKEARKILEQLPDLSYMLAKTLVFPRDPKY